MNPTPPIVRLPQSFLDMPRWWHEGADWLASLPEAVHSICQRWDLTLDGPAMHGSNAIVIPVRRGDEALILRMTLPDDRTADEIRALQFWDGRGTVRLVEADARVGASLLERLDGAHSLAERPLHEAIPIIARLMRRLAVPAPPDAPSTSAIVQDRAARFEPDWERLGRPFARVILDAALAQTRDLGLTTSSLAVNGDLHFEQVLPGVREPWLAVDPVLLRGDIEYDLARILWTRLDEMPGDDDVMRHFEVIVDEAALDPDRARSWVIFRTVDYWLWGLDYGLTEDPVRCARLARIFLAL